MTEQGPQPSPAAARPVFVDPSGRRQRRVRRFGRLLAIPAVGYVALLLSAALGGPSVDSPYVPLPAGGGHTAATSGQTPGDGATPAHSNSAAPGAHTARPVRSATAGVSPSAQAPGTVSTAPTSPTGTASTAPAPTAAPTTTHGKSTVTHPTPTHTGHGR